jgi:hypothetical protein
MVLPCGELVLYVELVIVPVPRNRVDYLSGKKAAIAERVVANGRGRG